jgi:S-formylglutathione hydrolase FrmB
MPLTGNWTLAALAAFALLAVVGSVLLWNRIRSWLRWPARMAMIVAGQLAACALVAALVNDANAFYGSWGELFGHGAGVSIGHLKTGAEDKRVAEALRKQHRVGKSLVVPVYIPEAGASRAQPALVYLPAAYFWRSYSDTSFPVVELLEGFPSTPRSWTVALNLQATLDGEIDSNRSLPFIAVIPVQNYLPGNHDGECINALNGPQVETTLTTNVRQVIEHDFRVDRGRSGWAVMGYSTGGFCALNIVFRHPSWFSAAVSLSGNVHPYVDHTTGDLFGGRDTAAEHENDPVWRASHLPGPPISVLLAASRGDPGAWRAALKLASEVRAPTRDWTLLLPKGAHNAQTWQAMEPVAFDWLSRVLPPPLGVPVSAEGRAPMPHYHKFPYHPTARLPRNPPLARGRHIRKIQRHDTKPVRPTFQ